jgi:HD superfamily phosphohydrolase
MKIIKDCIYGFVEVSDLCLSFLDCPEFQRLRHIKQLGVAHYVYPSAVHTRFEHSIGVMHLAGEVIKSLRLKGVSISEREKDLVQLAALIHDIGHVAFSHLMDRILCDEKTGEPHEDRSIEALNTINKRLNLLSDTEVNSVSRMINGDISFDEKKFLYEIVSNSSCGMDVDRFDYLQRDSYHTGITGFQPGYLIMCMDVHDNRLVFKKKSRPEIILACQTRSRLFKTIYRHPVVLKIENVIQEVILQLGIVKNWENLNWMVLDDHELMYMMKRKEMFNLILTRGWDKTYTNNSLVDDNLQDIDFILDCVKFV